MSYTAIKQKFDRLIADMRFKQEILDAQFDQLVSLQDPEKDPAFLTDLITVFCRDATKIFNEIEKHFKQPVVDYNIIYAQVHQLKGSSSSIGAHHVARYCKDFIDAFNQGNMQGIIDALNKGYNEFFRVREKFDQVVQLGQMLLTYNAKPK